MTQQIQPIFVLSEGAQKTTGRNAQRMNIQAAKAVADAVRTTLGPKGMDKMLVDSLGDVVISNDGVTILEEMNIDHPSAKMIVEIAKTQEEEVGDGTTTAVILAGDLLTNAESLIDKQIHPTVIARGYKLASEKAIEILNGMAEPVLETDTDILNKIAATAMTGKSAEHVRSHLSEMAVKAVVGVIDKTGSETAIDKENIKIEKKVGGSVEESSLVQGIILDKEKVHPNMPDHVANAKVALVDVAIEVKSPETDTKVQINDPAQLQAFLDMEEKMLQEKVEKIAASGANVLFCQKGIDDIAQHFLAKKGIYAVRRVSKSDMEKLARATGGKVVSNLKELSGTDLGSAGSVDSKHVGDEDMTFVQDCPNAKAVTMLIRGGTNHIVDEVKRAVEDAIGDLRAAILSGKVVAGGGAPEVALAKGLRQYAQSLSGREQLAVLSFADAIEVIPITLAENAGLDPIDVLTELKSAHDGGQKWAGIDVFTGKVVDSWQLGVLEPLKVKTQAVSSSSEVATMILRIDDVIASSGSGAPAPDMGGMGGMPPGMPGMM